MVILKQTVLWELRTNKTWEFVSLLLLASLLAALDLEEWLELSLEEGL